MMVVVQTKIVMDETVQSCLTRFTFSDCLYRKPIIGMCDTTGAALLLVHFLWFVVMDVLVAVLIIISIFLSNDIQGCTGSIRRCFRGRETWCSCSSSSSAAIDGSDVRGKGLALLLVLVLVLLLFVSKRPR